MQLILALLLALILALASPAAAQLAKTDGTAMTSGGTATIGAAACGTTPEGTVSGTDTWGTITIGGGVVTACVLTFSGVRASAPPCLVSSSSSAIGIGWSTTTSALTLAFSASLGGGKVAFFCPGV